MKKSELKFLQVGLGSMGKRRIRNLLYNKIPMENIVGFDLKPARRKEAEEKYGIRTYADFKKAFNEFRPDALIISTPPDRHSFYYLFAAKHKKHFFVEATTLTDGYDQLKRLMDGSFVAAPSCSWRYLPAIRKIKAILKKGTIGRLLTFQYHMGQYLPDWHPWEDYRRVYFARKATGACREMFPFELIWLNNLVGAPVTRITGLVRKVSDLDMPADDLYAAVVEYKNKVIGLMNIDAIARTAIRTLRLVGTKGVLDWDWLNYEIRVFSVAAKKWKTIFLHAGGTEKNYVTTEDMYREEIKQFLDAVLGKHNYPYTFAEDHQILNTTYALEKSSRTGKTYLVD